MARALELYAAAASTVGMGQDRASVSLDMNRLPSPPLLLLLVVALVWISGRGLTQMFSRNDRPVQSAAVSAGKPLKHNGASKLHGGRAAERADRWRPVGERLGRWRPVRSSRLLWTHPSNTSTVAGQQIGSQSDLLNLDGQYKLPVGSLPQQSQQATALSVPVIMSVARFGTTIPRTSTC